jgi:hypothetical protein
MVGILSMLVTSKPFGETYEIMFQGVFGRLFEGHYTMLWKYMQEIAVLLALALALTPQEVVHTWNLDGDSEEARNYLKGGTFAAEGEKGWYLITVDGYSMGWGKLAGGIMKNHYPKGLRKN